MTVRTGLRIFLAGVGALVLSGLGTPAAAGEEQPPAPAGQPPIPIRFTLDKPGVVTLVVDDRNGKRVRNLISETPFGAGEHVIGWDGRDDLKPVHAGQHATYRIEGEPVAGGEYVVRGIVRDPVHLRYEMPLYTAGNPPWSTADGRGCWLQDTHPATAVLSLPGTRASTVPGAPVRVDQPQMLLSSTVGEEYGIIWTDLEGQRLAGVRGVGDAGNGWLGAWVLARDAGAQADPAVTAYLGNSWNDLVQIHAMTQKPPVGDWNGGVRTMSVCVWGSGRKIYETKGAVNHGEDYHNTEKVNLGGLAVRNKTIVASMTTANKLLVIEDGTGNVTAEVPLESPRGLAVTADGRLLALSGRRLVRFPFPPMGEPAVLVAEGLQNPRQLALDSAGNIYVSDQGLNQVKVFTAEGKQVRTIGEPGGAQVGPYNPRRMVHPEGIAVAPAAGTVTGSAPGHALNGAERVNVPAESGQAGIVTDSAPGAERVNVPAEVLWVAEYNNYPKRVSLWTLDGEFIKALYGNSPYGGGGELDSQDATRAYVNGHFDGGMEFTLDWEKGTSELRSILYLPDGKGLRLPGLPQHAVYVKGQRYLSNFNFGTHGESVISLWNMDKEGLPAPVAAIGAAPKEGPFKPAGSEARFAWADLNDDGQVQPEELQFGAGGPNVYTLGADLSVIDSFGRLNRPVWFTKGGAPVYDLTNSVTIFPGARPTGTSGGGQVIEGGDGWAMLVGTPASFTTLGYVTGAKDGVLRWQYPAMSIGNHSGYEAPVPTAPGQMLGLTRPAGRPFTPRGTTERLWSVLGTEGNIYLLTRDGLFVATLFKDFRQAKAGPPKAERGALLDDTTLGQDCFQATLGQAGDGKVYVVAGHDSTWIVRVDGLESIRRLPEQKVTVTGEALEAVKKLGAISPTTHPQVPVHKTADGRAQFHYSADIRAAKGAVDSIATGTFADHPPAMAHCNGICCGDTVYKFFMPAAVEAIEASAAYGNHAGPSYTYGIRYSLDGKTWTPIVEETGNQGEFTIKGKVDLPQGDRLVWLSFAGIGNGLVTLKGVDVRLTYEP